jgi:hypothetical protein
MCLRKTWIYLTSASAEIVERPCIVIGAGGHVGVKSATAEIFDRPGVA